MMEVIVFIIIYILLIIVLIIFCPNDNNVRNNYNIENDNNYNQKKEDNNNNINNSYIQNNKKDNYKNNISINNNEKKILSKSVENIENNKKQTYDRINYNSNNKKNDYKFNNNIYLNLFYNNKDSYCNYGKKDLKSNYNIDELKNLFFDNNKFFENKSDKNKYWYMYELPDIKERLIILDTEVTGKAEKDRVIEVCAREMINGLLTGEMFHSFFKPKYKMSDYLIRRHKIPKKAFNYTTQKEYSIFQDFLKFIKDSLIITHNASYDMEKINKELEFHNLPLIDKFRFRCSMRIFLKKYSFFSKKFSKLKECCEFLKIKYNNKYLHNALYDTLILGKVMEKIYENEIINETNLIENNKTENDLKKILDINKNKKEIKLLGIKRK